MQRGNAFRNRNKKRAPRQPQQQRSSATLALEETSSKYIARLGRVAEILSDVDNNLDALRWFAISEGLVNDAVRAKAWPHLLGLTRAEVQQLPSLTELVKEHKDTDQVAKDVDRSLIHFMEGRRKGERRRLRRELSLIINAALCRNAQLNYFQGYHDIATVFLLVSRSEKTALMLLERLSRTSIRGAMEKTLEPVIQVLSLLFPLLSVIDPSTHQFLQQSGVEPYFALSWVLTWYSHDVHRWEVITRLFDAFLASHPLLPLYLAVVVSSFLFLCHL
ncbi:TBC1 domain family member 20-like protein (Fragment), variant 2 [Balamuthia mandrillaris]